MKKYTFLLNLSLLSFEEDFSDGDEENYLVASKSRRTQFWLDIFLSLSIIANIGFTAVIVCYKSDYKVNPDEHSKFGGFTFELKVFF